MDSVPRTLLVLLGLSLAVPSAATAAVRVSFSNPPTGTELIISHPDDDTTEHQIVLEDVTANGAPAIKITSAGITLFQAAACQPESPPGPTTAVICAPNAVKIKSFGIGVGDDTFDSSRQTLLPVDIQGSRGDDVLIGGPTNDSLQGSEGDDIVDGGPGNDTVGGFRDDDILFGGDGNDTLEPGPNSDITSGGAGQDTVRPQGGTFTLGDLLCNDGVAGDAPTNQRGVARVATAPEGRLECPGDASARDLLAGVETLGNVVGPVDMTGGPGPETLTSVNGDDRIEGGGGVDSMAGRGGADLLLARDGVVDAQIRCNTSGATPDPGDRAVVDANDVVQPGCETVERGGGGLPGPIGGGTPSPLTEFPAPEPAQGNLPSSAKDGAGAGGGDPNLAPEVQLPDATASIGRDGRLTIRIRCVYRAKDCVGTLTLTAAGALRAGKTKVKKGDKLGSAKVNVPWGKSEPSIVAVPSKLRGLLKKLKGRKTLRAKASVEVKDGAAGAQGKAGKASRDVTIGILAGKAKPVTANLRSRRK